VDVAGRILALAQAAAPPGIYHATSAADTTWFGLAQEVYRLAGRDPGLVRPTSSADLDRPAPRPSYSVLGHAAWERAGLAPIGDWRPSLRQALPRMLAAAMAG
jgi:dTDP-4-dehydrorhamnose reductase